MRIGTLRGDEGDGMFHRLIYLFACELCLAFIRLIARNAGDCVLSSVSVYLVFGMKMK